MKKAEQRIITGPKKKKPTAKQMTESLKKISMTKKEYEAEKKKGIKGAIPG